MLKPPMPVYATIALALFVSYLFGSLGGMFGLDVVLYTALGHEYTISHGMWQAYLRWPWIRPVWTVGMTALVLFLDHHWFGPWFPKWGF